MEAYSDASEVFLRLFLSQVLAVILAFNILEDRLHLLGLSLPFLLVHLCLAPEKLFVRLPVATTQAVPKGSELSVVIVEVKMVHGVAGGSVDHRAVGNVFTVVDQNGPEVDETEEENICELLERENEREQVVGHTLRPTVHRVESMRREGARHDPLVVRLVQGLVNRRVVQATVDPVDAEIGERDEERKLNDAIAPERLIRERVIEFGVTTNLRDQERRSEERHDGHRLHGLLDFHGNLVLEELRVMDGRLVPDKNVGEGGANKICDQTENPLQD